jgi:hypothetical protein
MNSKEIKTTTHWRAYKKENQLPDDIPRSPEKVYKDHWKGWKDFLGTE